jgi:hypothetical protein
MNSWTDWGPQIKLGLNLVLFSDTRLKTNDTKCWWNCHQGSNNFPFSRRWSFEIDQSIRCIFTQR